MRSCQPWILLSVCLMASCSSRLSYTFEMPKEEIQQKVDMAFPMVQSGKVEKLPYEITISDPVVILEEGKDQLGLKLRLAAQPVIIPGLPVPPGLSGLPGLTRLPGSKQATEKLSIKGQTTVFLSISYDAKVKAIRLTNPKITRLQVEKLPEKYTQPFNRVIELALSEELSKMAIPLQNKGKLDQATNALLKSIRVEDGQLLIELGV